MVKREKNPEFQNPHYLALLINYCNVDDGFYSFYAVLSRAWGGAVANEL